MEKRDTYTLLSTKLEEMRVSGRLDPSSTEIIQTAIKECRNRENYWLSNKEIMPQNAFVIYHAARNTRIVLEKMHDRFVHAEKLHENPRVVNDALVIFPELFEMCNLLDSLRTKEINLDMIGFLRRRVRALRETAQKVGMLPTIEEEAEAVNRKELAKELEEVAEHLRANLV